MKKNIKLVEQYLSIFPYKEKLNECRLLILFDFQLRTLFFSGTEQFFPGTQIRDS